ncbi:MAG: hypothetical protein R2798_02340 [Chitinophagales bacterium]|nr:DUF922 domain-containing protein [Bacteroidota bacterium]MCB9042162.1 DUF922 domain-containing protein [Chitinophagales bacterium]
MQHFPLLFLTIFGIIGSLFHHEPHANNLENDRIEWNAERLLNWDDFQGNLAYDNPSIAALTSSLIQYRYYCNEHNFLEIEVTAIFLKSESYVRNEARTSEYLEHEQLHFDITEVYARRLRQKLNKKIYNCNEVNEVENIANQYIDEWREVEKKYDRTTQNSLNRATQIKWNQYISQKLKEIPILP